MSLPDLELQHLRILERGLRFSFAVGSIRVLSEHAICVCSGPA